jgi:hypothetical protein
LTGTNERKVPHVAEWTLARPVTVLLKMGLSGEPQMIEIVQGALFVLAGTFLYGLVGFLFRDQITSRPMNALANGQNIVDMATRHSALERKRQ